MYDYSEDLGPMFSDIFVTKAISFLGDVLRGESINQEECMNCIVDLTRIILDSI